MTSENDLATTFASFVRDRIDALIVNTDIFLNSHRELIAELAARNALPAICPFRGYALAGALMSYGVSLGAAYEQVGVYVGRILNGAKPADLPVLQPTRFEFVINMKTAKALGLTVPSGLLAVADEAIG